jgi:hypothetical protein
MNERWVRPMEEVPGCVKERVFVGNSCSFGVEIYVSFRVGKAGVFASVLLWIGGKSLGADDDPMALYSLLGTLDGMLSPTDDALTDEVLRLSPDAAWKRFEVVGDQYRVHQSDFFDRYKIYCVSDDQTARFLWTNRELDCGALHDVRVPRGELALVLKSLHAVYDGHCDMS